MRKSSRRVSLRFYEELNDYLPLTRRKVSYQITVQGDATVGELIHAQGVPLAEVDLVLVNGESVDFARPVVTDDRIAVYPVFESFDVSPLARVPGRPLRRLRFAVDEQLAELAKGLRRRGNEVAFGHGNEVLRRLAGEGWVVLTRNPALIRDRAIERVYFVREETPSGQLSEVFRRFDLAGVEPDSS